MRATDPSGGVKCRAGPLARHAGPMSGTATPLTRATPSRRVPEGRWPSGRSR
jgi:hypothetical protein